MNRSVEQALTSLIPRHNGSLPSELIELASSLLAQSRNKASNLKAEEEIGRTYACANIACERLKQSLNLPKIEPRPPCPPRIYNKLYSYLDGLLVVRKRGRPPGSKNKNPSPNKALPSRPTPTKAASLNPYKTTPGRGASSRRRGLLFADTAKDIAPWIHPTIRALCKELDAPAAAPHILAGVTTVLTLPSPVSSDSQDMKSISPDKKDQIPALIAAVNFYVGTRLLGRETTGAEYISQRKTVIETLTKLRDDEQLGAKIKSKSGDSEVWEGWEALGTKDVDAWLLEIRDRGWLELDWFGNIVVGAGLQVQNGNDHPADDDDNLSDSDGDLADKTPLQSGLGTMLQDRVDYMSERKTAEYEIWKRGIMARIEQMELARTQIPMDTTDD